MKKNVLTGLIVLAGAGLLGGCASSSIDLDAPRGTYSDTTGSAASMFSSFEHRCDADPAQSLLGTAFSKRAEAEAIHLSGSRHARTLRPGQVITMEYDPERVTLRLDDGGKIVSIGCG